MNEQDQAAVQELVAAYKREVRKDFAQWFLHGEHTPRPSGVVESADRIASSGTTTNSTGRQTW